MDITKKIQAASHSGATLQVIQESGKYFVRKQIQTDIERNYVAVKKQERFEFTKTPSYDITAIPIVHTEYSKQELSITMPYVEGLGGEQVAHKGSKVLAKRLKTALDFYLIKGVANCEDQIYPVSAVIEKLEQISNKLKDKWHLFPGLEKHINSLTAYCDKDLTMPIGECHGDLTLSNLKVTEDNQLVLFDFLACDINSPLQDAAKLIQDFEYGWSFRKEKINIRVKGELFCEYAKPSFIETLNRLFFYEMRIVESLTILRIAPYIKEQDDVTIVWLNKAMNKTMKKITG